MGTSSSFGGPGATPLVPSWLEPEPPGGGAAPAGGAQPVPVDGTQPPAPRSPIAVAPASRFRPARISLSRFFRSGGRDTRSLGRAVAGYVAGASGGSRQAARRMGTSATASENLGRFLGDVRARGTTEALRTLRLESLANRPVEEVFLGIVDYVCPVGGAIDEGIARNAFIETIAILAQEGIADLNGLTADQMQTVLEIYITQTIEARLCNDIGARLIQAPRDANVARQVETQLRDFIRRGVSDALTAGRAQPDALTPERVGEYVRNAYERAFDLLRTLGEAEDDE